MAGTRIGDAAAEARMTLSVARTKADDAQLRIQEREFMKPEKRSVMACLQ